MMQQSLMHAGMHAMRHIMRKMRRIYQNSWLGLGVVFTMGMPTNPPKSLANNTLVSVNEGLGKAARSCFLPES